MTPMPPLAGTQTYWTPLRITAVRKPALALHRVPRRSERGRTGNDGSLLHDTVPDSDDNTHHLLAHRR